MTETTTNTWQAEPGFEAFQDPTTPHVVFDANLAHVAWDPCGVQGCTPITAVPAEGVVVESTQAAPEGIASDPGGAQPANSFELDPCLILDETMDNWGLEEGFLPDSCPPDCPEPQFENVPGFCGNEGVLQFVEEQVAETCQELDTDQNGDCLPPLNDPCVGTLEPACGAVFDCLGGAPPCDGNTDLCQTLTLTQVACQLVAECVDGNWPCEAGGLVCPDGTVGVPPVCQPVPEPCDVLDTDGNGDCLPPLETCPEGTLGVPPNCEPVPNACEVTDLDQNGDCLPPLGNHRWVAEDGNGHACKPVLAGLPSLPDLTGGATLETCASNSVYMSEYPEESGTGCDPHPNVKPHDAEYDCLGVKAFARGGGNRDLKGYTNGTVAHMDPGGCAWVYVPPRAEGVDDAWHARTPYMCAFMHTATHGHGSTTHTHDHHKHWHKRAIGERHCHVASTKARFQMFPDDFSEAKAEACMTYA